MFQMKTEIRVIVFSLKTMKFVIFLFVKKALRVSLISFIRLNRITSQKHQLNYYFSI